MASDPATVVKNIKESAITYYRATHRHMNLCGEGLPPEMQIMSENSSAPPQDERFESEIDTEEEIPVPKPEVKPEPVPKSPEEIELDNLEKELEELEKKKKLDRILAKRKKLIEERRKRLESSDSE
jgi:hypothetical protein